ncbi:unnamed protein product [Enterobius vermicularis]|uniref:Innexin n=1 Tax=Enterobius vermicularis TaxID=51028 RepID=A0A0N4UWX3_ENTVE|nr:unnamed protein product [Enterobius vermicularis]
MRWMSSTGNCKRLEIVVSDKWTSKDLNILSQILQSFKGNIESAIVDAPIARLLFQIIASMSGLDLCRWHAYLCMISTFEGISFTSIIFVLSLVIFILLLNTAFNAPRVWNYGVRSNSFLDHFLLDELRIEFTDAKKYTHVLLRNLYQFRCWIGSPGFGDRFKPYFEGTKTVQLT